MSWYKYTVKPKESLNHMRLTNLEKKEYNIENEVFEHPVNLEESYIQIIYPQRKKYISTIAKLEYEEKEYNNFHFPFENCKIDFSTALGRTNEISVNGELYIESPETTEYDIEISTSGIIDIFVNENNVECFAPMSRNITSKKSIKLPLKEGLNKLNIFARELAERDVLFNFELKNMDHRTLECYVQCHEEQFKLDNKIEFLKSLNFEKDEYEEDECIQLNYDNSLISDSTELIISEPLPYFNDDNKTSSYNFVIKCNPCKDHVIIDKDNVLPIGTYRTNISMKSEEGDINRAILISKYVKTPQGLNTLKERKEFVANHLAEYSVNNITKALLLANQGLLNEDFYESYENGIDFINTHADCADFQTVPLLWLLMRNDKQLSREQLQKGKKTLLDFRYWLDEPGNDAMWWFSENHAFLFHISQYLAGYTYPNEIFKLSGKTGEEQYEIGKSRLIKWFETFNKYEFAEWNSTTYFPVDFIGFIALYECAPDFEIKKLAKSALDLTFEMIQRNIHHEQMMTTYGRVYENELKGLRSGELTLITWMMLGKGYYNLTNRASVMFVLSDYTPSQIKELDINHVTSYGKYYEQGYNKVGCYIYKEKEFSIGAAINYKYKLKGHQQHMLSISLSSDEIQMWLNNPGEFVYSGESRPSYWAGNSTNPQIFGKKNNIVYNYDNTDSAVPYTHLYFPTYKFEKYQIESNAVFAENKGAYFGLISTSELSLTKRGAIANREVRFNDTIGSIFIVLGSEKDYSSLKEFITFVRSFTIERNYESVEVSNCVDKYLVTCNQFYVNNKYVDYKENLWVK